MKKTVYLVKVPPTMEMGSYSTKVTGAYTQSKEKEALWDYNSARAHDGLRKLKRMPNGTKYIKFKKKR